MGNKTALFDSRFELYNHPPSPCYTTTLPNLHLSFLSVAGHRTGETQAAVCNYFKLCITSPGPRIVKINHLGYTFDPGFLESLNDAGTHTIDTNHHNTLNSIPLIIPEDVLDMTRRGIERVAAVSKVIGYATQASFPQTLITAYRNAMALAAAINYTPVQENLSSTELYHWVSFEYIHF